VLCATPGRSARRWRFPRNDRSGDVGPTPRLGVVGRRRQRVRRRQVRLGRARWAARVGDRCWRHRAGRVRGRGHVVGRQRRTAGSGLLGHLGLLEWSRHGNHRDPRDGVCRAGQLRGAGAPPASVVPGRRPGAAAAGRRWFPGRGWARPGHESRTRQAVPSCPGRGRSARCCFQHSSH